MIAGGVRAARSQQNPGMFANRGILSGLFDRIGDGQGFDFGSLFDSAPRADGLFGGGALAPAWGMPTEQGMGPTANWDGVDRNGGGFFSNWF